MKNRNRQRLVWIVAALCFGLILAGSVRADDDDPPGRVARLSLATGQVSFSPAGTDDWVTAVVNRPLTTGDKLWTDQDGRVELHTGSTAFRLSSMTGFSFLNLTDKMMQVRLTEGTVNIRVRRLGDDESIEIDTPNLALSILRPGRYRVNVNEAGDTTILNVRDGQGEVTGGGSAYTVHAGEQAILSGTDSLNADIEALADNDEFDNWCNERDLREEHAASRRYVSDDVIGYEDLDDYGGWRPDPQYGNVWFPHVAVVDWAPYRYGHWAWISPWGWTWVDDAPWGFAPFHYGRWVSVRGAWGWVPCPPPVVAVGYVRPVYAPALVAWVGGPHFGFGGAGAVAVGVNVGWFPLGPREVYVPSYPVSRAYVNRVNISNTTVNQTVVNNYYNTTIVNKNINVNEVKYVNQNVPGGVTATSGQNFTSARPVNRNLVRVDTKEAASAPVTVAAPSVAPPKQAVLGSGSPSNFRPSAALLNRAVVAKTPPPPPPPTFAKQQAAIETNQGRPITMTQAHQLEPDRTHATLSPVRMAPAAAPGAAQVNNIRGNINRTNDPGPLSTNRPANTQVNNNNNRPPSARTNGNSSVDAQLEQKHQQQIQQLQQKQDQERQKLDNQRFQQQQQQQKQAADEEKQKQIQEKQQQQLQQMEQKHDQQQQQLRQKQEAEHGKAQPEKQASQTKSKPSEDKPHH
jgi:flagellar biosynthesis GTPase FlhF